MSDRPSYPVTGSAIALLALLAVLGARPAMAQQRACPERIQLGFGETTADIARRCGVTPEAIDRANPGLSRANERTGISVTVPRPALPSPTAGIRGSRFVPVPTPPGAFGR